MSFFNRFRHHNDHPNNVHPDERPPRGGFFRPRNTVERVAVPANGQGYNDGRYHYNHDLPNYYDPRYGSTASDWDHYAVRHHEALIGDPIPIMNNGLNLAAQPYSNANAGPYGPGPLANGPLNHGYDDRHYDKRHPAPTGYDRYGNPLIGPVTANGPLAGNLSSGTVVERNLLQGPGRRTKTGFVDDSNYGRGWGSAAWGDGPSGGAPLWGPGPRGGSWNEPLYGYRDSRSMATPLLPENPWTHNELGRDYSDGYRRGTLPYSSINNVFTAPAVTENYTNYGPNGEIIEGTRTRVVREEIVPPVGGLGQVTTTTDNVVVKDKIIPVNLPAHHVGHGQPAVLVEDRVVPLPGGGAIITEKKTPVEVISTHPAALSG